MMFSLLRVLTSHMNEYNDLIKSLVTILDREPPPLHVLDGLSDQYLSRRIKGQSHNVAMDILSQSQLSDTSS
jgi:hypothetical protein